MQPSKTSFFNYQTLYLFFFCIIYFSLSLPAGFPGFNIDASWHESLALAIDKKLIFGRDFIFNYGPLGYFNTLLLPKSVSVWVLVAAEVIVLFNYLIIIYLCFQKAGKNWWIVAILSIIILIPWGFFADISFTFFFFFLFWLLYAKYNRQSTALLFAIILSVLIFYIKVNLSIIVYGLFFISLIYFWIIRAFTFRTIITCWLSQLLITYALSFVLYVDIPAYLGASLKIIDAYQDAMATMILSPRELLPLLAFEVVIVVFVLFFIFKTYRTILQNNFDGLYLYVLIGLAWFLCFKQAHTAVGAYNVFGFFLFMPPLAVLIYLFSPESTKVLAGKMFISILIVQLLATQIIRFYIGERTLSGYLLTYPPNNISQEIAAKSFKFSHLVRIVEEKNPFNYIERVVNYNYEDNFKNPPIKLPIDLLAKIDTASIDIVPYQISHIYFNRLNYNPRPVIQSYQANSDWLMEKNGEKYLSKSAPEFVLFRIESFREQHPFWVETDLTEALLRHYSLTETSIIKGDTFCLFHRNKYNKVLIKNDLMKIDFKLNQEILIPKTDNPIRFSAKIIYSLKGKIARLFFQPPYLYCMVTYENGRKENFRVIDEILRGGVFINQKITTQTEVRNFFLNKGSNNQRVTKIRFWAKYNSGFEESFEGQLKEVKIQ
jgi:hypothetical protein